MDPMPLPQCVQECFEIHYICASADLSKPSKHLEALMPSPSLGKNTSYASRNALTGVSTINVIKLCAISAAASAVVSPALS